VRKTKLVKRGKEFAPANLLSSEIFATDGRAGEVCFASPTQESIMGKPKYCKVRRRTTLASSLKATRRRETDDDPIAGLKRAQGDYKAARTGYRTRQRQILQDVYRSVSDLLDDHEACAKFMKRGSVAKFAGHDGDPVTDRGDVWFHALAFVYQAKSRESRQRASKHASALRLLYAEDVDADQIAATIRERGGIEKLATEAAKPGRKAAKKRAEENDAEGEEGNGAENDDAVADVEEAADADEEVRVSISEQLTDKLRSCRGKRIKIIALVPSKTPDLRIKVLKVVKLKSPQR